ncbi:phosphatase PAP2 family protein [Sinanaerobacter chloroacetimidivorans]|jgi:undecaprenyl-diphosphatase|uniref:Phosphatase PAP2 family protein n=1 Tax=Sinanaerobacter chloroacetimidivorans TaxID=2818044 RepID=A0A8J8B3J6_9FIRM|nr:phosphatase PAP2 family protein [Sinanaerobacter chloroacetimidivorans]MBR0598390.1 phosphatase PAP2 family protein [Sinanaerobacter chloroacetimidivorans]
MFDYRKSATLLSFIIFSVITFIVMANDTLLFDTVVREQIYEMRNDGLTFVLRTITYMGNKQTISVICILLLLFFPKRKLIAIPLTISAIISSTLQTALKITFHRARPDLALHLIDQGGFSYPSGHSMTVLVFYGMMILLCRRYIKDRTKANIATVLLSCMIFLIGFSRIYLGVHYPTDVLGGWSIGFCLLLILKSAIGTLHSK